MSRALLYDNTLCIGCRECEKACAARWMLPYSDKIAAEEILSAHKLTTIRTYGGHLSRRLCMHCNDPSCVSACPVGAFTKTSLGPVIYDETKCIGCRYCMLACPFQVPTYEWSSRTPRVRKCDLCYDRGKAGLPTACSEACPTNATITGEREALIAEARRRISEKPAAYNQKIYGVEEAGGTSVLFLSAVPFEQAGLNIHVPNQPPRLMTARALSFVPDVVSAGSVLLGGVYWITHRREKVAREEAETARRERRS